MNLQVVVRPEPPESPFIYKLYVKSDFGEQAAGPRLARGEPLPAAEGETDEARFEYTDKATADGIAVKLQQYIDEHICRKPKIKKKK